MSDTAKDRILMIGARFSSYEHENAKIDRGAHTGNNEPQFNKASNQPVGGKMSFWKRGGTKVPGRAVYGAQHPPLQTADASVLNSITKTSKTSKTLIPKRQLSFQEFEGSTIDAWEGEVDDEVKFGSPPSGSSPPSSSEETISGSVIRSRIGHDEPSSTTAMPCSEVKVSQEEESAHRQPQALENTPDVFIKGRPATNVKQKQNIVSRLSESLNKVSKNRAVHSPERRVHEGNQETDRISTSHQTHSPLHHMKIELQDQENSRLEKFGKLLAGPTTDLDQLRKLSWNGIPHAIRSTTWQLLSGYLPPSIDRRESTLERKREEYFNFVRQYYPTRFEEGYQDTFRQIHIDIPRTNPLIPLFQQTVVQELFERVLYIWAIRHPASGYVQGINDLVVPFFVVFLSDYIDDAPETFDVSKVPENTLDCIEADTFWCVSKLLDGIQDNYTFAQPGIQMKVSALKGLVTRIDEPLHNHITSHNIDYLQFTFRWMNNLLMRELPLWCSVRLWDTYWSEPDGFAIFHLYVCAALMTRFSKEMLEQDEFQKLMVFLQNLPTKRWTDEDVSVLVAEAFRLKFIFADAPKHLKTRTR